MTDAMPRLVVVFETGLDMGEGPGTVPLTVRTSFDLKQAKYVTSGSVTKRFPGESDSTAYEKFPYADLKTVDAKTAFRNHAQRIGELVMLLEAKEASE